MTDDFDEFDEHTSDGEPRPNENPAGAELRQFIERLEQLAEEKRAISDNEKEVKAEVKGRGYDVKVIAKIIAIRKRDRDDLAEEKAILALYGAALGIDEDLL